MRKGWEQFFSRKIGRRLHAIQSVSNETVEISTRKVGILFSISHGIKYVSSSISCLKPEWNLFLSQSLTSLSR
jgi:hypothetical protein